MRGLILLLLFLSHSVFAQVGRVNKFFIKKGEELVYFDGEKLTTITTGNVQLCFPFVLKGTDLYQLTLKPNMSFTLIARGVTKVFNNNYLVGDKLYTVVDGKGVYVANGVTDVYNNCPDPYRPTGYGPF
jgi:hypothetical protein